METPEHDIGEHSRRCPRLGHEVPFSYCLQGGDKGGPCWKTADCWWEIFDVVAYLNRHFSPETVARLLRPGPPQPKVTGLVELIEQARQRTKNQGR